MFLDARRGNSVGMGLPISTGGPVAEGVSGIIGGRPIVAMYSSISVDSSAEVCQTSSLQASSSRSHAEFNCCHTRLIALVIANSIQSHSGCSSPSARHVAWMWSIR